MFNLIANSRQGRKAAVIHIADLGCSALAQAKNTKNMGNNGSDKLSEALRGAEAIAAAFRQVTVCRKCRSKARANATSPDTAKKLAEDIKRGDVLVGRGGQRIVVRSLRSSWMDSRATVLDTHHLIASYRDERGVTQDIKLAFGKKYRVAA